MQIICAKCNRPMRVAHYDEIVQEGPVKAFFYPCTCVVKEIDSYIRAVLDSIECIAPGTAPGKEV